MPLQVYPYQPVGGINGEVAEDQLEDTQVQATVNMLYGRKMFYNRPGAVTTTLVGFTGDILWAKSLRLTGSAANIAVSSNGKIYRIDSPTAATEITSGTATTFTSPVIHDAETVNAVIMIASNSGGMIRWDPAGTVYTVIAASNYRYTTSLLSRIVGAYKLDGSAGDETRIGWSRSGDETLWTGGDSGTTNIVDAPEAITGLTSLHNVVAALKHNGIHLGFPTGLGSPVFRFENWSKNSIGCNYPMTLATYDNKAFFVSQRDVHMYDLQSVSNIGGPIRRELIRLLRTVTYFGFISPTTLDDTRVMYHLVPASADSAPHFTYDLEEDTWARHHYGFTPKSGFQYVNSVTAEYPVLLCTQSKMHSWTPSVACEQPATLTSKSITLSGEEFDHRLQQVLLKYRNFGVHDARVRVRAMLGETATEIVDDKALGTVVADQKLYRKWFNTPITGQGFEITLEIPENKKFAGMYLGLKTDRAGEHKGVL